MPPSTLIGTGQGRWTDKDRLIAVALHLYEKSRCSGCGGGVDEWDTEQDYVTQEHTCPKCAAQEKYRAEHESPEPGVKVAFVKESPEPDADNPFAPVFDD